MLEMKQKSKEKLQKLEQKISAFKKKNPDLQNNKKDSKKDSQKNRMTKKAMNAGIEFISAVVVATIIGIVIDKIANTTPLAVIAMFLIGIAAGILNILRFAKQMNKDS